MSSVRKDFTENKLRRDPLSFGKTNKLLYWRYRKYKYNNINFLLCMSVRPNLIQYNKLSHKFCHNKGDNEQFSLKSSASLVTITDIYEAVAKVLWYSEELLLIFCSSQGVTNIY